MDDAKPGKVTTEGSTHVLNEVKGRLERIETGELPVIEKIGPDGSVHQVDQTGEMIRPDPARIDAVARAAEAFASEHQASLADQETPAPSGAIDGRPGSAAEAPRRGLWARIVAWFKRS